MDNQWTAAAQTWPTEIKRVAHHPDLRYAVERLRLTSGLALSTAALVVNDLYAWGFPHKQLAEADPEQLLGWWWFRTALHASARFEAASSSAVGWINEHADDIESAHALLEAADPETQRRGVAAQVSRWDIRRRR